jgi:hypothetical protein
MPAFGAFLPTSAAATNDAVCPTCHNPWYPVLARKFGLTPFVNPREVRRDLVPYLVKLMS